MTKIEAVSLKIAVLAASISKMRPTDPDRLSTHVRYAAAQAEMFKLLGGK